MTNKYHICVTNSLQISNFPSLLNHILSSNMVFNRSFSAALELGCFCVWLLAMLT